MVETREYLKENKREFVKYGNKISHLISQILELIFNIEANLANLNAYFSALYFSRMACCGSVSAFRKVSFSAMMHSLEMKKVQ